MLLLELLIRAKSDFRLAHPYDSFRNNKAEIDKFLKLGPFYGVTMYFLPPPVKN
jgi:hypothetical protein